MAERSRRSRERGSGLGIETGRAWPDRREAHAAQTVRFVSDVWSHVDSVHAVGVGLRTLDHFHHDGFEFSDGSKPPHSFDVSGRLERYGEGDKVAYLERDPRDVMVSLYRQITGRFGDVFEYEGGLSEFIRDDYFGALNLKRFRDMWHVIVQRRQIPEALV